MHGFQIFASWLGYLVPGWNIVEFSEPQCLYERELEIVMGLIVLPTARILERGVMPNVPTKLPQIVCRILNAVNADCFPD